MSKTNKSKTGNSVSSVTTIYKKAVPMVMSDKGRMDNLVVTTNLEKGGCKISLSSDELIDTSDESLEVSPNTVNTVTCFIADIPDSISANATKKDEPRTNKQRTLTPEEHVEEVILER